MKLDNVQLPSNRKFGFFFTFVFFIVGSYLFLQSHKLLASLAILVSVGFLSATLVKPDALFRLNQIWMKFGLLLGKIVSPIVLGILFFALFTPIAMLMRVFKRDELRLVMKPESSYWKVRSSAKDAFSFKQQF